MPYSGEYGPWPNRGIDPRRLVRYGIGFLIAIFGIVSYMTQSEINPVTGRKQYIGMSVDEEMSLGLQAAPKMAAQMGGRIDPASDRRAKLVAEVGSELVRRSDASRSPYVDNYHFYLLNDPKTINAFALPGGQIFITRALFDKLRNEGQLAGVLGHEIGHVVYRHSAQQMAKGQLGQVLTTAVGIGASGNDRGVPASRVASLANQMMQLRYGRKDETEADAIGLAYMADAGYDPSCMLDVMHILKEAGGEGGRPEMLSTHPLPDTRLQEIKDTIAKQYPNGIPSTLSKGRSLSVGSSRASR